MAITPSPSPTPFEWKQATYDYVTTHPALSALVVVILAFAVAVGIIIFFATKSGLAEHIKDFALKRRAQEFEEARQKAEEGEAAAREALREVIAENELMRVTVKVAGSTIRRANANRSSVDFNKRFQACIHACDWIQRIFGFMKPDVNKVTIWIPNDAEEFLFPYVWNGIEPESASKIQLPLDGVAATDTFAAMAYRSGNVEVCSNIDVDPRYRPLAKKPSHPYKSIIAAPVCIDDCVVGVLTVDSVFEGTFDGSTAKQLAELSACMVGLFMLGKNDPEAGEDEGYHE